MYGQHKKHIVKQKFRHGQNRRHEARLFFVCAQKHKRLIKKRRFKKRFFKKRFAACAKEKPFARRKALSLEKS